MNRQIKSMFVAAVVTGACLACHSVNAGIVDLSTFSVTEGVASLTPGLATISTNRRDNHSRIAGIVDNLNSFDFRLQRDNTRNQAFAYLYFRANNSVVNFADLSGTSVDSGTLTYRFPVAYSGAIEFVSDSIRASSSSTLSISNLRTTDVLSAVPEPDTFAMLLAGMGLMGTVVRGRQKRPTPAFRKSAR